MLIFTTLNLNDSPYEYNLISKAFETYGSHMYNLAYSILNNHADAEDVVQNVFLKITENCLDTFVSLKQEIRIKNYLLIATRNTAFNLIKKPSHAELPLDECEAGQQQYPSDSEFIDMICNRLECDKILSILNSLSAIYKDPLYFHFVIGLSIPATAATLGRNASTVEKQLNRGKKLLISKMKEEI